MRGATSGRPIPPMTEADERRFWAKVQLPDKNGCMEWTAAKISNGYGQFWLGGSMYPAHRISYTLSNGPIPPRMVVDHLCRNRACVNPLHLEAVSQSKNVVRGEVPRVAGQWNREKTHCPAGHAYDEANTYVGPNGGRMCRTCKRERDRARRAAVSVPPTQVEQAVRP